MSYSLPPILFWALVLGSCGISQLHAQRLEIISNSTGFVTDQLQYAVGEIQVELQRPEAELLSDEDLLIQAVGFYPNPVRDWLQLDSTIPLQTTRVHLYDLAGKLVVDAALQNQRINLSSLPSGMYLLRSVENEFEPVKILKY